MKNIIGAKVVGCEEENSGDIRITLERKDGGYSIVSINSNEGGIDET